MWPVIFALVWKQLKQRYHRNYVSFFLALIQPFFGMVVLTIVFTVIARVESEGVPYPAFNYAGLVPWFFMTSSLRSACLSMTSNANLVTRLRIPRLALPVSAILAGVPAFVANLAILAVVLLRYDIRPGTALAHLAPVLVAQTCLMLGLGFFLAPLNAYSRLTGIVLDFFLQLWFVLSPVAYSVERVSERHWALYALNPMTGITDGWRKVLLHHRAPDAASLGTALVVSAGILVAGWLAFRAMEKHVADAVA